VDEKVRQLVESNEEDEEYHHVSPSTTERGHVEGNDDPGRRGRKRTRFGDESTS
jgi:hypothetical protein